MNGASIDEQEEAFCAWIATFGEQVAAARGVSSLTQLSDGVLLGDLLHLADAEAFPTTLLRRDNVSNWLLRVNNVIKLSEALHNWCVQRRVAVRVDVDAAAVARAADRRAVAHLVGIVLTCMVSSDDAARFVQPIVGELEPAHQAVVKRAIELHRVDAAATSTTTTNSTTNSTTTNSTSLLSNNDAELDELRGTLDELRATHDSTKAALDSALAEKRQLLAVVSDLELRVRDADRQTRAAADALAALRDAPPPIVDHRAAAASAKAAAEEEIAQLRAELEQREAELGAARRQLEHAAKLERQLQAARDEAELARDATQRVAAAESAAARMRERLEQHELLKQQLADAHAQLAARATAAASLDTAAAFGAATDADGAAAEVGRLRAQLASLQVSLQARETECVRLRAQASQADAEIAQLQQLASSNTATSSTTTTTPAAAVAAADGGAPISSWLDESNAAAASSSSSAELVQLRAENEALRQQLAASPASASGGDAARQLAEAREKVSALTADKARLEGYLKTAKQMIRDMRSKEKGEKDAVDASATRDLSATVDELRQQLAAKDDALAKLNARLDESAKLAQREQQLMLTAFYEAGLELQRLKGGARSTGGQQSFLQRQRAAQNKRDRL